MPMPSSDASTVVVVPEQLLSPSLPVLTSATSTDQRLQASSSFEPRAVPLYDVNNQEQLPAADGNRRTMKLFSRRGATTSAEIRWCFKSVLENFSCASSDGLSDLFVDMFPCEVAEEFTLSAAKQRYYVTDALAPFFYKLLLNDCKDSSYTLSYDETANSADKKELQVGIRYFSKSAGMTITMHLETFFLNGGKADAIFKHLNCALDNAGLSLKNVAMLSSGRPNVNKTVFRMFNEIVIQNCSKSLLNIGFCHLHVTHNAFCKGLEILGFEIGSLAYKIHIKFIIILTDGPCVKKNLKTFKIC